MLQKQKKRGWTLPTICLLRVFWNWVWWFTDLLSSNSKNFLKLRVLFWGFLYLYYKERRRGKFGLIPNMNPLPPSLSPLSERSYSNLICGLKEIWVFEVIFLLLFWVLGFIYFCVNKLLQRQVVLLRITIRTTSFYKTLTQNVRKW